MPFRLVMYNKTLGWWCRDIKVIGVIILFLRYVGEIAMKLGNRFDGISVDSFTVHLVITSIVRLWRYRVFTVFERELNAAISTNFGKHICTIQNHHNGVDCLRLYLTDKPNKIYNKATKKIPQKTHLCLFNRNYVHMNLNHFHCSFSVCSAA